MKRFYSQCALACIGVIAFCGVACAAGACLVTGDSAKGIGETTWTCTSDASGDVSGEGAHVFNGLIYQIEVMPDGTDIPSDNYDLTIDDGNTGLDILAGAGANLPDNDNTAITISKAFLMPLNVQGARIPCVGRTLTPTLSNMGNAKKVTIKVYTK